MVFFFWPHIFPRKFIKSDFLFFTGLFKETANKAKSKVVQKLYKNNEQGKILYNGFCNRFHIKKG